MQLPNRCNGLVGNTMAPASVYWSLLVAAGWGEGDWHGYAVGTRCSFTLPLQWVLCVRQYSHPDSGHR